MVTVKRRRTYRKKKNLNSEVRLTLIVADPDLSTMAGLWVTHWS